MLISTYTLYKQCLMNVAWLLKHSYWTPRSQAFKKLKSGIIDDLINFVTKSSSISEPLERSHLQLLLTSGRVRHLILKYGERSVNASALTIRNILIDILPASQQLLSVSIRLNLPTETRLGIITPVLNSLLTRARKVYYVESDIPFDLRVLSESVELHRLHLRFDLRNPIEDILKVNGQLRINTTLTELMLFNVYENQGFLNLRTDIILNYCTELLFVNFDIAKGLEHLYDTGSLKHAYKIRWCFLGRGATIASPKVLSIASSTCPDMENLLLAVSDREAISAVRNFHNLHMLSIFWNSRPHAECTMALTNVLEMREIGHDLSYLRIYNFVDVDLSSIGVCCPHLECLILHNTSLRYSIGRFIPASFPKLHTFLLHTPQNISIEREQLVELLYSAINLRYLSFVSLVNLTDDVLEEILRQNPLPKLQTLQIFEARLSLVGIEMLASTARSLKKFQLGRWEGDQDAIRRIFREINPRVELQLRD